MLMPFAIAAMLRTIDMHPVYDDSREDFRMRRISFLATCTLVLAVTASAAVAQDRLQNYANCTFSDGLMVVHTDALPATITSRPVETDDGTRHIDLEAGLRIMFAYPLQDFYANVK